LRGGEAGAIGVLLSELPEPGDEPRPLQEAGYPLRAEHVAAAIRSVSSTANRRAA